MIWLLVSSTMTEPPYVASQRVELPEDVAADESLKQRLLAQAGVSEVNIIAQERSAYVKIDSKLTNRFEIEQLVKQPSP